MNTKKKLTLDFVCDQCGDLSEDQTRVETRSQTFTVKGEPVTVEAPVRVCANCDTTLYDRELDTASQQRFFDIYRQRHHLITPDEITELRARYGLSQRALGALLGLGEISIHRYETLGSLPVEAQSLLLQLMQQPGTVKRVLQLNGARLSKTARAKVEAGLNPETGAVQRPETPKHRRSAPRTVRLRKKATA